MKTCPYCHAQLYDDSIRCTDCGRDLPDLKHTACVNCGKVKPDLLLVGTVFYCQECAIAAAGASVLITTTPNLEGFKITRYLDIETAEIVLGGKVTNLQDARYAVLQLLKLSAFIRGASAVVGIDLDYTEFSGARLILVASGTLVEIQPA